MLPVPAVSASVWAPAAEPSSALLNTMSPPLAPVVIARLASSFAALLTVTLPPAPCAPGVVPAPAPPVVLMSPPRSIRVVPVNATAPPAPPTRVVVSVLSAALPTALIAPVVSTPPEFSVTPPAARPTPFSVRVPPLVVMPPVVKAPVVVTLTAPPAASAPPVVVMANPLESNTLAVVTVRAEAVRLASTSTVPALLIVTAPSLVPPPTAPLKSMLPVPVVNPRI